MANGDKELIAVPLDTLVKTICDCMPDPCRCTEASCNRTSFYYRGSVSQTFVCHVQSFAFQVPPGNIGVIERITFAERYPGTFYGANFMLMINDNLAPEFPRIDHNLFNWPTRVCLPEQATVSVLLQCSWQPVVFSGQAASYVQTIFIWEFVGYFEEQV